MAGTANKNDTTYQNVNFHFRVNFNFNPESDIAFQSVTGLDSVLETESVKEGGENRFTHVIPVRRRYGPLILKRGILLPSDSQLTEWLQTAFEDEVVIPRDTVVITLLNESHKPLMYWKINNVWPLSWKVGELNAETGNVLIETLELNYNILILDNL
ncbi:MAG TPA: phage tail protein [Puia sp.]|nr:phage tail protein [Puia sp.]